MSDKPDHLLLARDASVDGKLASAVHHLVVHAMDAREAEREATPPTPAVDDEPGLPRVRNCQTLGCTGPNQHVASPHRDTLRAAIPAPEPREDAVANSKPAPSSAKTWRNEREDAVEALARVYLTAEGAGQISVPHRDSYARLALAALDRGAVPGYGPTGDRAGEERCPSCGDGPTTCAGCGAHHDSWEWTP